MNIAWVSPNKHKCYSRKDFLRVFSLNCVLRDRTSSKEEEEVKQGGGCQSVIIQRENGVWCILILGNNLHGSETAPSLKGRRRFGDSCRLEVARRLCQDAAVKGGKRQEIHLGEGQNDALHVCTCAHLDVARDLPEDVLSLSCVFQDHLIVCRLFEIPRDLNDVDPIAREVDVIVEKNV